MTGKQYDKIVRKLQDRISKAQGAEAGYSQALASFVALADCPERDFDRAFPPLPENEDADTSRE